MSNPAASGIYRLRNTVNGKVYVGQSNNMLRREREHLKLLRKGKHYNDFLQKAWNFHGEQAFAWEVIVLVTTGLDDIEREQISLHRSTDENFGYNLCIEPGNAWRLGMKNSPSHREAISKAKKGKPGPKHTQASRNAISKALTGKTKSEGHRKALSTALLGNIPYNLGVPHTELCKQHMKEAKATFDWEGKKVSLNTLASTFEVSRAFLAHRMKHLGMTLKEAIETPLLRRRKIKQPAQGGLFAIQNTNRLFVA